MLNILILYHTHVSKHLLHFWVLLLIKCCYTLFVINLLKQNQLKKILLNTFATIDIETIKVNKNLIPYLISGYNGSNYITSYVNNTLGVLEDQQAELFKSFIFKLFTFFTEDSNTLIIYAHNFSSFDGVFLLKHLLDYGDIKPLYFNGKLISIKIKLNIDEYKNKTIIFKDSMLFLPDSLRNLCKAFNINVSKGVFPMNLNDINYSSVFPSFKYFNNLTLQDYLIHLNNNNNKMWDFKDEAIKYCKLDCKCLHQIMTKFNELIFNEFSINVHNVLTLPALAMRIFKTKFMPKNTIYQLHGIIERNIRQSYTGGSVDSYIPHNKIGNFIESNEYETIYHYDANALYPTVMTKDLMPVGKPIAFLGNIRQVEPDAYGFFYCKITSPEYLEHPILQRRIRTSDGLIRTIAGLGSWQGWLASHEMDNAMKFGYQFEIIRGYEFELGDIFSTYIEKLYNLRLQYGKGTPMNLIAKLLMNSLYGKFGMSLEKTQVEIYDTTDKADLELFNEMLISLEYTVSDYIKIDNFYVMVRKTAPELSNDDQPYHGVDVNIAIASAITAGARMWMSILKNNSLFNLYYSDTDSIVVDKQLPSFMVGSDLGQYKLEHTVERAVFLAPKVYGLLTTDGTEIIKMKGVSNEVLKDIHIQNLENLLIEDSSLELNQEKWIKIYQSGDITIKDVAYSLKITSNKRSGVYLDNVFSNTEPINYDEE